MRPSKPPGSRSREIDGPWGRTYGGFSNEEGLRPQGGDETPKGFSCVTGNGGNLTPFSCFRRNQIVKVSLEG
jgi:hypothetical protein